MVRKVRSRYPPPLLVVRPIKSVLCCFCDPLKKLRSELRSYCAANLTFYSYKADYFPFRSHRPKAHVDHVHWWGALVAPTQLRLHQRWWPDHQLGRVGLAVDQPDLLPGGAAGDAAGATGTGALLGPPPLRRQEAGPGLLPKQQPRENLFQMIIVSLSLLFRIELLLQKSFNVPKEGFPCGVSI